MEKIFVVPKKGLRVPDPASKSRKDVMLPAEGRLVVRSVYWDKRLRDGDVEERSEPSNKASSADAKRVKAGE